MVSYDYWMAYVQQERIFEMKIEQCQMVVVIADVLGFWGPGILDLVTELCPPQDTA